MRCRRAIRTLLVFVLLGAIATVLSSWAIHAFFHRELHRFYQLNIGFRDVAYADALLVRKSDAAMLRAWAPYCIDPPHWFDEPLPIVSPWPAYTAERPGWRAYVAEMHLSDEQGRRRPLANWTLVLYDAGWPLLAMRQGNFASDAYDPAGGYHEVRTTGSSLHHGVHLGHAGLHSPGQWITDSGMLADTQRFALPLLPLWPGFAINTFFYALLLFGAWRLLGVLRRAVRRRGGRCVGCGYDRGGLDAGAACPECGAGVAIGPA